MPPLVAGTTVPIRLNGEINTKTAKAGDTFQASAVNVFSGASVALPAGAPVIGRIVEAKAAGRLGGADELSLELVSLQLNRQPVAITTRELSRHQHGGLTTRLLQSAISPVAMTGNSTASLPRR